ncbi:MAG: LptF/LptG family permease, partial [Flavobacteriaceae bacterium]
MKILDRYILTSFLKTFFSVFIILMFIFVLQTIWLYISELAGKDLSLAIILKFLWFFTPKLIPLVLPLTILVTSLMVFGTLSEQYEFAAMKSTGISLQRAMRSLSVFILLLAGIAFIFANNVIPYSEYKWQNLRRNIAQVSPSMAIVAGQFSAIGDDF